MHCQASPRRRRWQTYPTTVDSSSLCDYAGELARRYSTNIQHMYSLLFNLLTDVLCWKSAIIEIRLMSLFTLQY